MLSASDVARMLAELRQPDGGFGPSAGAASEPEPTAMAALALDDARARTWLVEHQREDGGWLVGPVSVGNDSATALGALATSDTARERALDHLVAHRAVQAGADDRVPHDTSTRGWGWTPTTFGWVEPTARATMALKLLRPTATSEIADGLAVLADRECTDGGWNYGNRRVLGVDLPPSLQTTASALLALQDDDDGLRERGVAAVQRLWRDEPGGLGWAMSVVALRLCGRAVGTLPDELARLVDTTGLLGDVVSLSWTVLALGDGWQQLQVAP
jgi:hypothetical protein